MAREVKWTEAAWNDLEGAAEYIARDSPAYAAALVREAREAARSLRDLAQRGRIVPEFGNTKVRELLVGRYRLIYQLGARDVLVIAFVHGARDLRSFLQGEEGTTREDV